MLSYPLTGLGRARVSLKDGIIVEHDGSRYALDPRSAVRADYVFVSHAHLDHVHNSSKRARVIASKETAMLASARGYDLGTTLENVPGIKLLDSGHILGARAICIEDEVLYTGDAAGRSRAFLGRCETRKAKTLIIETTFGKKEYIFPSIAKLVKEVNTLIGTIFDRGRPVVLMGYPLGKAQIISDLFSAWAPIFVHERVAGMNNIYRECGIKIKRCREISQSSLNDLPYGPWVLIAPLINGKSQFMMTMKKRYNAVTIAFSGWAINKGYRTAIGVDHSFPLSDHCDYQELMKLVEDISPELVYTTHGFSEEFARELQHKGFDAKPLNGYQSNLFDYSD
jgi:putative mRNA 3-end processing factor